MSEIIQAVLRRVDRKGLQFRRAERPDFAKLIGESTTVLVDGKIRIHFQLLEESPHQLVGALSRIRYSQSPRTRGLLTQSRVFGFQPRVTIRRDYCTAASLSKDQPGEAGVLAEWAARADRIYRRVNPELYGQHAQLVSKVLPCWRMGDTVFTSGIANRNNPLAYHLDAGNFPNVWSAMYALAHDCEGGYLSVPELDIGFDFTRPALIMFDGQGLLHGVTPLREISKQAWRYSVVFYALQQLCRCGTPAEELARIRLVKTQREIKRRSDK